MIRKGLLVVFLLAFVARAGPVVYREVGEPGYHEKNINEIEFYYDDVARSLIAGKGFVHSVYPRPETPWRFEPGTPFSFVPPLYAWWLAIVYFLFGPDVFIAKMLQCLMDALVCPMIFFLGKRMFRGSGPPLLASALYAFYPLAVVACSRLYYQIPMNLTLCWTVLCLLAPVTWRNGFWTGLSLALTSLAKPVTLPLIGLLPAAKAAESLVKKSGLRQAAVWTLAFTITALAVITPWTVRNFLVFRQFVPVQHGGPEAFYQGSREDYIDLDVVALRARYGRFGLARDQLAREALANNLNHLRGQPLDYLRFLGRKFLLAWYNTEGKSKNLAVLIVQLPFLSAALLGLLLRFRFWVRGRNWYVPGAILYVCLIQVAIFPLVRYTLAVMPLVMLLAASGIVEASSRLGRKTPRKLVEHDREEKLLGAAG